jgi:ubiquitin carboxyl-terminal hydrolase 25/28
MRPAFLKSEWINRLTDKVLLKQRWEAAKQEVGGRAEGQIARPVDGLDFLGTYLTDSLNPQQGKTKIPLLNRKFLKTFGRDCNEMLTALGFTPDNEKHEDGTCTEFWYLPTPPPAKDSLDPPAQRTCVEDSKHELAAHLLGYPETERQHLRRPVRQPESARQIIEQALDCEECR